MKTYCRPSAGKLSRGGGGRRSEAHLGAGRLLDRYEMVGSRYLRVGFERATEGGCERSGRNR